VRIVIDARPAEKEAFGIARYVFDLIKALIAYDKENRYFLLVNSDKLLFLVKENKNFSLYKISSKWKGLKEQVEIPSALLRIKPDVFHATSFVIPYFLPCKTVISILDLIHQRFPENYSLFHRLYFNYFISNIVRRAKKIITISEFSKQDILRKYKLIGNKVKVTYLANSSDFYFIKDKKGLQLHNGLREPFILSIGSEKPHKNIINTIKAFKLLKEKYSIKHKLVVVGKLNEEVKSAIISYGFQSDIILKRNISSNELNILYNLSDVFVFPTKYEGFGLPILEAMAAGTPVVTSNISSVPEVAGNAGLLVDPENVEEIAEGIYRIIQDPLLREIMIRKGFDRVKNFSWQKCAAQTLEVYKEAIE